MIRETIRIPSHLQSKNVLSWFIANKDKHLHKVQHRVYFAPEDFNTLIIKQIKDNKRKKKVKKLMDKKKLESAIIIQRTYKKHLSKKRYKEYVSQYKKTQER